MHQVKSLLISILLYKQFIFTVEAVGKLHNQKEKKLKTPNSINITIWYLYSERYIYIYFSVCVQTCAFKISKDEDESIL